MARIDAIASSPWYLDHIEPVWRLLGGSAGRLHVKEIDRDLPGITTAPPKGDGPVYAVSYGDIATARRTGRTILALGQHGAGQSYLLANGQPSPNPSYPGGVRQESVGLFLVPNLTASRMTAYRYPKARIEIVGCPKLDTLPKRKRDGTTNVVAISTHWPGHVAPEAGSAWQTFQKSLLALAKDYKVIGHAHPRVLPLVSAFYRAAGVEIVQTFDEVCRRADLYICDNSSTLFEFAATGRPVVVINSPQYRRHVEHGLRFWAAAAVGVNANHPDEVGPAVARALERRREDVAEREAALSIVYQPRKGAAALAAAALIDWATDARPGVHPHLQPRGRVYGSAHRLRLTRTV